ncbi:tryptophan-rich sensory protein [Nocardioides psychrotolerans]|uniref:TspO and MBR related proteins n=1 Tax=Nocardioides psychrotolerans TaxID=1005945 RepID=A0A1I3CXZ1_9ACTN|nr:TspO/MBR family protein [Nocardioides psychrotolerans]GEP36951.1 tryptophan-rich sensory protein [Nocardioides psychrotolerans]SFH79287.1 TspO and MBR related proteins [Nocardioides psychrotolerans]
MTSWSTLRTRRGLRILSATGLGGFASAGIGAAATTPDTDWYRRLEKPPWDPPTIAYPLVWTPLYADIALTSAAALTLLEQEGRRDQASALRRALATNLVLNTGWSVLFWRVRRPWLSAAWCAVLAVQSAALVKRVGDVDPSLGTALAPYPLWCGFAAALNTSIARRNS